jgi:hypothetical protein
MVSITASRWAFWGIVILLGVAFMAPAQELPAQSTSCVAVDQHDQPRPCTFLEAHGGCLWNALDSYYSCTEDSGSLAARLGCEIGVQIDLLACNVAAPLTLLKTILR